MTTLEKLNKLVELGIPISRVAERTALSLSAVSKWRYGEIGLSHNSEEQIDKAIQSFVDEFYRAFGAINNQSPLSELQTAKNGEAT